jgi:hypothetical protein
MKSTIETTPEASTIDDVSKIKQIIRDIYYWVDFGDQLPGLLQLIASNNDLGRVREEVQDPRSKYSREQRELYSLPKQEFVLEEANIVQAILLNHDLASSKDFIKNLSEIINVCNYSHENLLDLLRLVCSNHIYSSPRYKGQNNKLQADFKVINYIIEKCGGISSINSKEIYLELLPRFLEQELNHDSFIIVNHILKNLGGDIDSKFSGCNITLVTGLGREGEFKAQFNLVQNLAKLSGAEIKALGVPDAGTTLDEIKNVKATSGKTNKNIVILIGHGHKENIHTFELNGRPIKEWTVNIFEAIINNINADVEIITTTCHGNYAVRELKNSLFARKFAHKLKVCALGNEGIAFKHINKAFEELLIKSNELGVDSYLEHFKQNSGNSYSPPEIFDNIHATSFDLQTALSIDLLGQ